MALDKDSGVSSKYGLSRMYTSTALQSKKKGEVDISTKYLVVNFEL